MQLRILEQLREHYPEPVELARLEGADSENFQPTVFYLREHDLVEGDPIRTHSQAAAIDWASITADGLDFLEDDGGLRAILRTVTIKFDPEDFRMLLAAKVDAASIDEERKRSLLHTIRALPAEGLRHLTLKLLESAMDHLPDAFQLVQTIASRA